MFYYIQMLCFVIFEAILLLSIRSGLKEWIRAGDGEKVLIYIMAYAIAIICFGISCWLFISMFI